MSAPERTFISMALSWLGAFLVFTPVGAIAQPEEITFHKDIEPILQRSCQNCHRLGGVGPMPLVTYEEVAPFAGLIEYKTGLRDRAGAMPPWYMEKDIGIQDYKNDPSLSEEEIATIVSDAENTFGVYPGDVEVEVTYDVTGSVTLVTDGSEIPEEELASTLQQSIASTLNVHPSDVSVVIDS